MTEKELKKLKRTELLEMLLVQTKRVEELERELEKKNKQLEDKRIVTEQTGNLADAVLKLNGVFEAAQKAAEQYLYNIKCNTEEKANKDVFKEEDNGKVQGNFQGFFPDNQYNSKEIIQDDSKEIVPNNSKEIFQSDFNNDLNDDLNSGFKDD